MNILDKLKEIFNKLKEIIKSKEGITLVGVITLLLVITIINVAVKDTHAYYNSVTDPVQIFNGKVGNFKPRIDSFYIKEITTPKYTNIGTNIVYITPGNNNSNLDQVCITETNDINDCNDKWQSIQSNNQYSYTFTTEGQKVIFGFVKDRYGNKSLSSSDVITYDVTSPTVSYSVPEGTYNANQTVTVTPSDAVSGVGLWMVHAYKNSVFDEVQSSWDLTGWPSYNVTLTEGYWTVYSRVYDNTSNIIVQEPNNGDNWFYQNYTIDTTPPTVWYSLTGGTYTGSQTVTITPSDNLTGVGYWVVHVYKDGAIVEQRELTGQPSYTVTLTEGSSWTVYASIYDNAGNLITQQPNNGYGWYYQNYTINKPGKTGQDLINERESNSALQDTAVSGLYRYYGSPSQVTNNYICLGPIGETCQSDEGKNKYMYRILGIADGTEKSTLDIDEGSIKVIKAISIGDYPWNTDGTYGVDWDKSTLQKELNSTLFYNSDLLDQRIKGKIKSVKWYKGNIGYSCSYDRECPPVTDASNTITNNPYPIGLMYASDYRNSWAYWAPENDIQSVGYQWLCEQYVGNLYGWTLCKSEYTMTLFDNGVYPLKVWYTNSYGDLECYGRWAVDSRMVRPVFYLVPNISLIGGGTEDNPFTINS